MNYIINIIIASIFLCSCNNIDVELKEIVYPYNSSHHYQDVEFITPDLGFAATHLKSNGDKADLFERTSNGGKTWQIISLVDENATGIQYYNNKLYFYSNIYSNRFTIDESVNSNIFQSNDMGLTWHNIHALDSEISNFHVVDSLNMFIVKVEIEGKTKSRWLYQSQDGGTTWSKVNNLPSVKNTDYVSYDDDKVYFYGDGEYEKGKFLSFKSYIYSYDIKMKEIMKYTLPYFVFALYVSDGLLSTAKKGGKIEYYQIDDEKLTKISDIDWGHFFGGAIMSKPLIKDGKYVFSFISQYPGRNDIDGALFFSDNGGKRWKIIREFNRKESIRYRYSFVSNDTIFQIAYPFADSLRIYRVNKK